MTKWLIGLITVFTLFSCREKEETIDFSDLAPNSGNYENQKPVKAPELPGDDKPDSSPFLGIADTLLKDATWKIWDTTLFADRFGPKFNEKYIVVSQKDSMTLQHYTFSDSLRTKNAFFNYLDCFGKKCQSYVVGDNLRIPKRNALILVSERDIYIFEGNSRIDEAAVRQQLFREPEKERWIYIVAIPKSGKTSWKRVDLGEETLIQKSL